MILKCQTQGKGCKYLEIIPLRDRNPRLQIPAATDLSHVLDQRSISVQPVMKSSGGTAASSNLAGVLSWGGVIFPGPIGFEGGSAAGCIVTEPQDELIMRRQAVKGSEQILYCVSSRRDKRHPRRTRSPMVGSANAWSLDWTASAHVRYCDYLYYL